MRALYVILPALGLLVIAYRYYSAFIAARIMALDDSRVTPAHLRNDGQNYHPTNRYVLFGHHFAAISGAGPLIGPVLAMQFGFAPGLIWLVAGVCLAGAVHDSMILWASTRRGGRSLSEIARSEIGPVAGTTAAIAILFIVIIALAGLGLAVANALQESAWGTFTIGVSIPLALFMGLYMYRFRKGRIGEATIIGVIGLFLAVILGKPIAASSIGHWFLLSREQLIVAMAAYGFIASVLPVWMLLCPRDYLSSFMKIGTIGILVIAVIVVNPTLEMPAFSEFTGGGGPIIPGPLFPFAFITIACGAISGFHSLIASGTTPKMIDKETDIRPIGYGAMLMEGLVGIVALVAAAAMHPGDYYAINTVPATFANLGIPVVNLPELEAAVGENVAGRPGGAVSLAVGIAQMLTGLPGMRGLMDYWYHFAIMFEALFILTTIDTGTRVARFLVQEYLGAIYPPLARKDWIPGAVFSTLLVVLGWSYFIWTGSVQTIWPMFGIANQLLAAVALAVATTIIINIGKARYAWVTVVPLAFVSITTLAAGVLSVRDNFWPMATGPNLERQFQGYLNTALTVVMMTCVVIVLANAIWKWMQVLSGRVETVPESASGSGVGQLRSLELQPSIRMAAEAYDPTTHPPVALRSLDGRNERRHHGRRNGRRFGDRDRRHGERRKHALRTLLLAAATMSASHVSLKSQRSEVPALMPGVSVEMSNFVPIRPEHAYEELIQEAARVYKLDPNLIRAVMRTESAFNPGAVSPVGAMGLMQLMPDLAEEMGVADPFEPRDNIMGGAKYLKQLLQSHGGNLRLTLASYNAGPGNVKRYGGVPPFEETRNYVRKITELLDTGD